MSLKNETTEIKGGAPRGAGNFQIQFAEGDLNFRNIELSRASATGRKILAAAGIRSKNDYSLFAILPDGDFEDIRLDEPFDVSGKGAERFVAFQTDRLFKLTVKDKQIEWGKPVISGTILYKLAAVSKKEAVFLKVPGADDRLIEPEDMINLNAAGIERFVIGAKPVKTYEITVNGRPRVVEDKIVSFEQVVELAFPGPHGPNIVFSMTFRHAASRPHAGELGAGGKVEVKKEGTIFNVTKTDKS